MRRAFGAVGVAAVVAVTLFVALAPAAAATGTAGTINVFAGNGIQGFTGNGGAAAGAEFHNPSDEAVAASGTVYIADMKNCQVRQVAPNGTISAFAGIGTCPASTTNIVLTGLGGPAVNATIGLTTGVAVDPAGNVYIADCVDYTGTGPGCLQGYILKVSTGGIMTVFAGDATVGDGGSGGQATATSIGAPWGVRADSAGNVYFSDVVYSVIRKVDTSGIITTVAGDGVTGYSGDNGPATTAELNDPTGLYVDGRGNLFVADSKNAVVRKVNATGTITTFAGNGTSATAGDGGPATLASLAKPFGVIEDTAGNVYIADYNAYCVREVNPAGIIATYAGRCGTSGSSGLGGPVSSVLLVGPSQLAFDPSGNLYINDYAGQRVDVVTAVESTKPAPTAPAIANLPTTASAGGSFVASVSTDGDGTKSVVSTSPSVCTVGTDGLTVSFVGAGTCTLTAQVATGKEYSAATGTPQTLTVTLGTPTTPVITNVPSGSTVGGTFVASVSTSGDGTRSVLSGSPSICTVGSGGLTVSFVGAGTCSLTAQVTAGKEYAAATGAPQTVTVVARSIRPTVSAVSPKSGPTSGGTAITITGTGFVTGATVRISQGSGSGSRAIAATNVKVVSSTRITAVTGGGARAGTWNLYVVTSGGTSATNAGDTFIYK